MQILNKIIERSSESFSIRKLHTSFVMNSKPGEIVINKKVLICQLEEEISNCLNVAIASVYISSKTLKHLYDKRSAQEYDFLLGNIEKLVKCPDLVYKNRNNRSGDLIFIKAINGFSYMCSLKLLQYDTTYKLNIITAFSVKPDYMKNFKLVWSGK